ncbi:hypothetical protein Aperf_G00000093967 [Anoplocephala perfoliata]
MLNESSKIISESDEITIGIEVTEDMTPSTFEASTEPTEWPPSVSSAAFSGGRLPHRSQSFPTSPTLPFEVKYPPLPTLTGAFQKPSSFDPLYFDELGGGITDFKEDLTTEVALFHACEDVIYTLEASMFSSRLPKSQQRIERILVGVDDLLDPLPLSFLSKSVSNLRRFTSLPDLSADQEKETKDSLDHAKSLNRLCEFISSRTLVETNADSNGSDEEDMTNPESCQTALVAGGLLRAVLQDIYPPTTRLPLRLRQLQERLATMSDADWVKYQMPAKDPYDFNEDEQPTRFGLPDVSSFSAILETGSRDLGSHNNEVDPLLSPFEATASFTDSPLLPSKQQQRSLVGVENFFRSGGTITNNEQSQTQKQALKSARLSRLASKNLIISPIIPKAKRKGILTSQHNRCFGCGVYVETRYLRRMRFCEYFGRYFCSMCHSNTLMVLPGALLQSWSGTMYPVSKFARDLLIPLHNRPLLHNADFGPALRRKPPGPLLDAIQLRKQALAIVPFLKLCPDSVDALDLIGKLPSHWTNSADNWSMYDLVCLANTPEAPHSVTVCLRAALEVCVEHIYRCVRCRARGHLCEVCHSGRVLFPNFGQAETRVCSDCGACFHRRCLAKLSLEGGSSKDRDFHPDHRSCSRCARIRQRKQMIEDSALVSSQ